MNDDVARARPYAFLVIACLAVAVLIHAMHRCGDVRARAAPSVTLESKHTHFTLFRDGRIRIATSDGARTFDGELIAASDDGVSPLALADLESDGLTRAHARTGGASEVTFTVDAARDALDVAIRAQADAGTGMSDEDAGEPAASVGIRIPTEGRDVFLAGRGELADVVSDTGKFAVLSDATHPIGVVAGGNPITVAVAPSAEDAHMLEMRATVPIGDARFTLAVANARRGGPWPVLFDRAHVETKRVKGFVTGAPGATRVIGLDDQGAQQMVVGTDVAGRFDFRAPPSVTSWYASASATRTSAPVIHPPGTAWDLKLDVSDGGELHVRALDADTKEPITARLLVHGLDGTLDPSFGPDYRASGAGPIIDALHGDVTTPLPAGKYRVSVTKGIEWSIDSRVVEIDPGKRVDLELSPRHVVPTPDEIACDLHVHARPSFDSPVSPEDRVLSLVAAGIDFAVPTEHNLVGDYGPSLATLGLEGDMMFVPGVEITTYSPRFGHFGIFPYPIGKPPPPFKHTDIGHVFAGARAGDADRVLVVHHPRLARDIGYFSAFGWKPGTPPPARMRLDFDAIEVFNGYESASIERVEAVLHDYWALLDLGHRYAATGSSDSHRIQYQWAGYPRTMVRVDGRDTHAIVAAIKAGHATVTTGPIVELELEGVGPGGDVATSAPVLSGHLVVRAAPWVDVTSAEIVVGDRGAASPARVVQTIDIASRPAVTGPETGALEEAQARTVRLDTDIKVAVGDGPWVMVIVRGKRTLEDILPFMPIQPFAVTNPIFIHK
ncbi:MAG TPA: CehA/McbA family metallohydrolase [Polyangiaceae bacterium]|jgi:hypothetical protein